MNSSDLLLDKDSTPLLYNDKNDTTLDEQDGDGDTSGLVVSNTSSTLKASLPLEPPATEATIIQVLDSSTDDSTTTTTGTVDDQKLCRICGEGEDFYDDDRQHDDEESLIGMPIVPTTTTMTRQHAPKSGYSPLIMTTRHHNDSILETTFSHNDTTTTTSDDNTTMQQQQEQHSQLEVPPTPTSIIMTPTKPRRCSNNNNDNNNNSSSSDGCGDRKRKKWIQQTNPLIRPCHCKGTMMYVHVSCLNRWRAVSPRSTSCVACDLCGYEYNLYRPRYAAIVTNRYFLRFMTIFLVVLATVVCAYLCKLVDMYLLGHSQLDDSNSDLWRQWHGTPWLGLDLFYLLAGLMVVSMLGMVYLTFICVTRPEEVTYLIQSTSGDGDGGSGLSFFCCDQTSCPWYTCYLADFAACSGDSAAGGFLIFVVLMSLLAIVFGVFGAVTGIFRLMEYWVDSIAGHLKERILDVN